MTFPFDGTKNDITNYAFQFLEVKDLSRVARVCKDWKVMADDKAHWERLLTIVTNYRCEGEHPKQTYHTVKLFFQLPLQWEFLQDPEFARFFLQTPHLTAKSKASFVGLIARFHPDLIKIIAQDVELSKKLLQDVRDFIKANAEIQIGVYGQLIALLKNNHRDLMHIINQDIKLADSLKGITLSDTETSPRLAFSG